MPVVMAVILISVPIRLRLGCIVDSAVVPRFLTGERRLGGYDRAALLKMQVNQAFQVDREAEIVSRRKNNYSATRCRRCFNGAVDGLRIQRFAVAGGAIFAH